MKNKKIACIITTYGTIPPDIYRNHISCLIEWAKQLNISILHCDGVQQYAALNNMIDEAHTKFDPDYYFFMEHDNVYNKDTLPNLLKHDKPIVTGFYCLRQWPFAPIPLRKMKDGSLARFDFIPHEGIDSLMEVEVGCFGSCLVKKEVFEKVGYKCFKYDYIDEYKETLLPDVMFFRDAMKKGFKIYVDGNERIGHLGRPILITPDNYKSIQDMYMLAYPDLTDSSPALLQLVRESYGEFFKIVNKKIAKLSDKDKIKQ